MFTLHKFVSPAGLRAACLLCLSAAITLPVHAGRLRYAHGNAEGGVTQGAVVGHRGEAGKGVRGRRVVTDGQGNARATSGAAYQGVNGGSLRRAGQTTRAADGSMNHASGLDASGAKGSVQSQGSTTRDASGNVTQNRSTSGSSASTGNSFTATESYIKGEGVTRSVSCFDAAGAPIACPKGSPNR